jgi:FAD/FMN-containing dehydrogenase
MTLSTDPTIDAVVERLRDGFHGRVVARGEADFEAAAGTMYVPADSEPLVVAQVADVDDVVRVVTVARELGLPLAIRSGGHSGAGFGRVADGIVCDVRGLDSLDIDADARTAWAGSGLTAAAYTAAATEHGLATGFGDTGSVGLGGLITGGGIGYLTRLHGLTIDSLLAAEIVTADGTVHVVDAEHEPDLFWAVRGAGANVGVVTRFQLRLHPLPEVTGGMLILPATADVVAGFLAAAEAAPDELTTIANVMPCPPMPFVPEQHHGELVVFGMLCYAGPPDAGLPALAPFRALAEPVADLLGPTTYPTFFPPEPDEEYHPTAVATTIYVDELDRPSIERLVDQLATFDAPMRVAQLRVLGGAAARVADDATAYAHRQRKIMGAIAAFYDGEDDRPVKQAWIDQVASDLPLAPGQYVNFVNETDGDGAHQAYPDATWDRLAGIKRRYDPTNLFRRNQNVPPAGGPAADGDDPDRIHVHKV